MVTSRRTTCACALALAALAVTLTACQTRPDVRTHSAPTLDLAKYRTFGFVEHPDTDKAGYTTLITRYLKDAVTREMLARGYTQGDEPDLLVNFSVASKDKVESTPGPAVGVGWGSWRRGYGWGWAMSDRDVRTVTEGSLTIDVVDRERRELIWTGTASGRVTSKVMHNPQPAIDDAVSAIFAKYPRSPQVGRADPG